MGRWMASVLAISALAAGAQDRSADARSVQLAAEQTTATSPASAKNGPATQSAPTIVIDQFGYPPTGRKVAVVRSPAVGFDAGHPFRPGDRYLVVDALTGETAFTGEPKPWRSGQ